MDYSSNYELNTIAHFEERENKEQNRRHKKRNKRKKECNVDSLNFYDEQE